MIGDNYSYDPETGHIYWKEGTSKAGKRAFVTKNKSGYLHGRLSGTSSYKSAHHMAWFLTHGYFPSSIDHRNGDKTDNRLDNLREVGQGENSKNQKARSHNTSGHCGVWKTESGKYQARGTEAGVVYNLGRYTTLEEAVAARQAFLQEKGFTERHGQ